MADRDVRTKRILLASLLVVLAIAAGYTQENGFVTIKPEPGDHAWWLRAEFRPIETDVRGIPAGKIRATWCKATEFRNDLFPPETKPELDNSGGLSFAVDGSFDGSKVPQTALVGVYETCAGERGTFFMIMARPQGTPPAVRFVHEMTPAHFATLKASKDATIVLFHCMECDHVEKFKWDRSKRRFRWLPQDPDL